MALLEGKTPAERNKLIAAIAFGAIALLLIGRMFFGSSDTPTTARRAQTKSTPAGTANGTATNGSNADAQNAAGDPTLQIPRELIPERVSYSVPDAGRNIFAFYVAPTPLPKPPVEAPTPTPPPPPPLTLGSISPSSVTARTGDFPLQLSGDKFTPETRVYIDGQELPTTFASAQQISTTVPAALISAPGARTIVVRTPDNSLYSNQTTLNVAAPPTPQYTFVGILGSPRYNDKAILKAQNNDLITVQRGDMVAGRFKVTSISTRTVEFTDTQLQIKHTLPYVENRASGGGPPNGPSPRYNPPPKPADDTSDDDDEPQD
jgi:hypothetical protein